MGCRKKPLVSELDEALFIIPQPSNHPPERKPSRLGARLRYNRPSHGLFTPGSQVRALLYAVLLSDSACRSAVRHSLSCLRRTQIIERSGSRRHAAGAGKVSLVAHLW